MIRDITKEDISIIYSLGKQYDTDFKKHYILEDYLNNDIYLLKCYEIDSKVVGFLIATKMEDNIDLLFIFVDKNNRKEGIASNLIDSLWQCGVSTITLEVSKDNKEALPLYKKIGFKEINVRKGYYHGIDGIVMQKEKDIYILSIETSCDETSIAIVKNGHECIALTILTQMDTHAKFGGVVPEIASRMHTENITMVLEETLNKAGMKVSEMDAIAVAYKPGLLGSLLVGVEFAKVLSYVYDKPLIGVNHLIGHIYANNLEDNLEYPLLALVISGGHTELAIMHDDYDFEMLGTTMDDAIGEAFDKVARVIGYPYPGGPNIEKAAIVGKYTYELSKPVLDDTYNFSYSGLKSQVINLVNTEKMKGNQIRKEDLAYSFQKIAVDELERKLSLALKNTGIKRVVIAGGVSANKYLQGRLDSVCNKFNAKLYIPRLLYCTDNGAMIGAAAYPLYLKKEFKDLSLNAESHSDLI